MMRSKTFISVILGGMLAASCRQNSSPPATSSADAPSSKAERAKIRDGWLLTSEIVFAPGSYRTNLLRLLGKPDVEAATAVTYNRAREFIKGQTYSLRFVLDQSGGIIERVEYLDAHGTIIKTATADSVGR